MISVAEAQEIILHRTPTLPPRQMALSEALGLVLAEPAVSDVDSPPHDKSLVDGYAVVSADLVRADRELLVLEEVTAGRVPSRTVEPGTATRIMTGAPIPRGADAVVMVERTELRQRDDGVSVVVIDETPSAGQNILPRATSLAQGETILEAGRLLRPIDLGVLAEIGRGHLAAIPCPEVSVLATGDELVDATQVPEAGKIRNSNGPLLVSSVAACGGTARDLGIARDTRASLTEKITQGLASDVLLLSGGVSAGVLDLVPQVLRELRVEQVFHKVNVKPGKPLWFGVCSEQARPKLVFGLPGNPVSSLVCFELFVRPCLAKLAGRSPDSLAAVSARLTTSVSQRGTRPTYFPSRLREDANGWRVETLPWKGSADQRTLLKADCFALLPPGDRDFEPGETVQVLRMAALDR